MHSSLSIEDLSRLLQSYQEFLRARDLIQLGLYRGRSDVTVAKRKGEGPPFIKLSSHRHVYPKTSLIAWLMGRYSDNKNSNPEGTGSNDSGI